MSGVVAQPFLLYHGTPRKILSWTIKKCKIIALALIARTLHVIQDDSWTRRSFHGKQWPASYNPSRIYLVHSRTSQRMMLQVTCFMFLVFTAQLLLSLNSYVLMDKLSIVDVISSRKGTKYDQNLSKPCIH